MSAVTEEMVELAFKASPPHSDIGRAEARKMLEAGAFAPYAARKITGSYRAEGHVISEFVTLDGKPRLVFEFEAIPGMLHIFAPNQVERA